MAGTTLAPAGRHHKRTVTDQQKRRELALQRQKQGRRDLQHHARQLALSAPTEALDAYGEQTEDSVENEVSAGSPLGGNMWSSLDWQSAEVLLLSFLEFVTPILVLTFAIARLLSAAVRFAGVRLCFR